MLPIPHLRTKGKDRHHIGRSKAYMRSNLLLVRDRLQLRSLGVVASSQ